MGCGYESLKEEERAMKRGIMVVGSVLVVLAAGWVLGATIGKEAAKKPAAAVKDIRSAADRAKDYTESAGGVKMEMVWVPAGSFTMGSTLSAAELVKKYGGKEKYFADAHPAHTVELDGFWMGKFEVTNAQYRKFRAGHDSRSVEGHSFNGDDQPVVMVSWEEAKAFCDYLSKESGKTFTLPTEARWEYACRAGTKTERYWGDDDASMGQYANTADRTFEAAFRTTLMPQIKEAVGDFRIAETTDGYAATAPAGKFRPNAYGLHDMVGNVQEWCSDWYGERYYAQSPPRNPTGPLDGQFRVVRGGHWGLYAGYCRSAFRFPGTPDSPSISLGFRVVRTQEANKPAAAIKDIRSAADRAKDYTETAGGVKMEMVWVPAGSFAMGSTLSAAEIAKKYGGEKEFFADEHPAHTVELDGFWMGKFEVTNAQFRKFRAGHHSGSREADPTLDGDDQPVAELSWEEAKAFCDYLSKETGKTYTLPTEARWEYACRAGTKTERYWGDDDASMGQYANTMDRSYDAKLGADFPLEVVIGERVLRTKARLSVAETSDGYAVSAPVGKFRPNAYGLHDMIGNVSEWCSDWYGEKYYAESPPRNPTGPSDGQSRVLRGGSSVEGSSCCRSAVRLGDRPGYRYGSVGGFRVVRGL
jgi:formylglycine-generating enzyme required for sulfatase activity